jgi:cobalamin biosynthesis protein CobW
LPKPLVKAFGWPEVRSRVTVDGVIAVVDAATAASGSFEPPKPGAPLPEHENPLEEVFTDQLQCADLIVVNKTDQLGTDALKSLSHDLARRVRPGVKLVETRFGALEPAVALGLQAAAEDDLASRPSHIDAAGEHDHDDFESFVVTLGTIDEPQTLTARLRETIARHDILRVKGFLDVPGKAMRLAVQGVGPRIEHYYDRAWGAGETRASLLVVIGRKGLDRVRIEESLAA